MNYMESKEAIEKAFNNYRVGKSTYNEFKNTIFAINVIVHDKYTLNILEKKS